MGKCIVASWYGKEPIQLKLGTAFHRSHIKIIASQVIDIPGDTSATWTKARRFECTWDILRTICPSKLLQPAIRVPLSDISTAYQKLDEGAVVVAHVDYYLFLVCAIATNTHTHTHTH